MTLESRSALADDIGRQIASTGTRNSAEQVCNQIDSLNVKDVQKLLKNMLKVFIIFGNFIENS